MNKEQQIPIILDHNPYKVPPGSITGAALRALPTPPIAAERDLWQDVPGGDDAKIGDMDTVTLKPGMHFYSAPKAINPGVQ